MTAAAPERRGVDLRRFLLSAAGWPYLLVPGIGGFLNVTFGNAPELIIAFFAAHLLLRLMAAPPFAFFSGPLPWLNLARPIFAAMQKAAPLPRDR